MNTAIEDKLDRLISLMEKQDKTLLTLEEARERLNIGVDKMRELVVKNSFPKVMNGHKYLVIASELDEWVSAHKGINLWFGGIEMSFWKYVVKHWYFRNIVLGLGLTHLAVLVMFFRSGEVTKSMYAFGFWFLLTLMITVAVNGAWSKIKNDYRAYRRKIRRGKYVSRSISEYKAG